MQADWLINYVNDRIARIAEGPFFQFIAGVTDRSGLFWVHQLAHMSRGVIQALLLRASRCGRRDGREGDVLFLEPSLRHAVEEAMHPIDLERWARVFDIAGTPGRPAFCGVAKTSQTERLLDHLWLIAEQGSGEEQVVVLNMVTEGVALAFYSAALETLRRLGMSTGRYWGAHKEADAGHALLGADLVHVDEGSDAGSRLLGMASVTLDLFEQMLSSWVPEAFVASPPEIARGLAVGHGREASP